MKPSTRDTEVGPWARDKLERLRKHLNAYTTIMRKQRWCQGYVYVDAFAGPGRHRLRQREPEASSASVQAVLAAVFAALILVSGLGMAVLGFLQRRLHSRRSLAGSSI